MGSYLAVRREVRELWESLHRGDEINKSRETHLVAEAIR